MVGKLLYLSDLHTYMWSRDAYLVSILQYSSERKAKAQERGKSNTYWEENFLIKCI